MLTPKVVETKRGSAHAFASIPPTNELDREAGNRSDIAEAAPLIEPHQTGARPLASRNP
jgi:hypothetical protein